MVYRILTKVLGFTGFMLIISGIVFPFVIESGEEYLAALREYYIIGDAERLGAMAGIMKFMPFIGLVVAGYGVFAGLIVNRHLKYAAQVTLAMWVLLLIGFRMVKTDTHPLLFDSVVVERGPWVWLFPAATAVFVLAALLYSASEKRERSRRRY
ncbi:MAG: hypothetical protein LUE26_07745 [Alistipes sp.]|nr:hypothetical protein [Alistipes sp.]